MAKIDPYIIDQIRQAADIVEVIGEYLTLKKKGANLWANCPFHGEKSPSFSVSPTKGIYKCFGCSKAGDSIRFVMDMEGVGYVEALKQLAKKYAIEIPEKQYTDEEEQSQNQRESLYLALNYAKNYYHDYLLNSEEGKAIGLSYFKERGFNEATIKAFELGHSPDAWSGFTDKALSNGFTLDAIENAGLTIVKNEEGKEIKTYDRFRGRVIFPIHNVSGKTIAFGARILKADKNQPKYVNSPETEVYSKSNILYGIYQAKNPVRSLDVCYLCEGYTDVVSLHQAGIHNVVASSGTSLTIEQIKLIGRFTQNIVVLYDGDAAGIKASLRGMDMILEEGLNVKLAIFPEGEDPDSYVQKIGSEAFISYIKENAQDFITFKAELSLKEAGNDPIKRAGLIHEMVDSITKIPDSIKRSMFFQKTAQIMGISEDILRLESNKILIQKQKNESIKKATKDKLGQDLPDGIEPNENQENNEIGEVEAGIEVEKQFLKFENLYYQEEETIRLLLNYSHSIPDPETAPVYTFINYILDEINGTNFETPHFNEMISKIREIFEEGKTIDLNLFHEHENEEIRKGAIGLSFEKYNLSEFWDKKHNIHVPVEKDNLASVAFYNLIKLKMSHSQNIVNGILANIPKHTDVDEQNVLLNEYMKAKEVIIKYSKELGIVVRK